MRENSERRTLDRSLKIRVSGHRRGGDGGAGAVFQCIDLNRTDSWTPQTAYSMRCMDTPLKIYGVAY